MATTNLGKVSVTPKGEYDPLITYERLDVISHNGSSYIVKQASTGVTPIEGEFYALIAEKGDGGSFVKKAYKTYAAMDADKVNIPENSSVDVTNDPDESKNGAYIYDGVAFTRSQYDSKVVTDKIIADANQSVQNAIRDVAIDANLVTDALTTIAPITTSATARTQLDKNRESVSILDFFTAAELTAYRADKTTFDAYRPIQEFFTYIASNDVGVANATLDAYIGTGIYMGRLGGYSDTRIVRGTLKLTALAPIDTMVYRELGMEFEWQGGLILYGQAVGGNLYTWANRTCRIGVGTQPTGHNSRQKWGFIRCFGFQFAGTHIIGANTASSYAYMRNTACGVGYYGTEAYRLTANFSNKVDTGSSSSGAQRSTINVDYLPPENVISALNSYIVLNDETYIITNVDQVAKTVTVFPWIDATISTGKISYVFGGGVVLTGKDSSSLSFGVIEGTNNGINFNDTSLYSTLR